MTTNEILSHFLLEVLRKKEREKEREKRERERKASTIRSFLPFNSLSLSSQGGFSSISFEQIPGFLFFPLSPHPFTHSLALSLSLFQLFSLSSFPDLIQFSLSLRKFCRKVIPVSSFSPSVRRESVT